MGPWYDIAVHMHREDLRAAEARRQARPRRPAPVLPAGLAALGLAVLILVL